MHQGLILEMVLRHILATLNTILSILYLECHTEIQPQHGPYCDNCNQTLSDYSNLIRYCTYDGLNRLEYVRLHETRGIVPESFFAVFEDTCEMSFMDESNACMDQTGIG